MLKKNPRFPNFRIQMSISDTSLLPFSPAVILVLRCWCTWWRARWLGRFRKAARSELSNTYFMDLQELKLMRPKCVPWQYLERISIAFTLKPNNGSHVRRVYGSCQSRLKRKWWCCRNILLWFFLFHRNNFKKNCLHLLYPSRTHYIQESKTAVRGRGIIDNFNNLRDRSGLRNNCSMVLRHPKVSRQNDVLVLMQRSLEGATLCGGHSNTVERRGWAGR